MTSFHLKGLWIHEAIRLRPGMYVESENRAALARRLVELALARLCSPAFANEAGRVTLTVWKGPTVEFVDDGRGWPLDSLSIKGVPMSRIDWVMTEFHLEPRATSNWREWELTPEPDPRVWGPFVGFGAVLNALSSRVFVRTSHEGVTFESRYSRGGIISPAHALSGESSRGTRMLFELDPLLFDSSALEHATDKMGLAELVSCHPTAALDWKAGENGDYAW